MSPRCRGSPPSKSSPVRTTCPVNAISCRSLWCSGLSCLIKNCPCLSSGLLIGATSSMASSGSRSAVRQYACASSGCVSSLAWKHTPFSPWGFTKTCNLGSKSSSSSASSSWPSMSTSSVWSLGICFTFSFPDIQIYPSSFVDVWNSPALHSFTLVLAIADWWNASCWKSWL